MECRKCGKELKNGVTVCSNCGTKVDLSSSKIPVHYDHEVEYVDPPIITESHTFISEEDFLKKVKDEGKKRKKKRSSKQRKKGNDMSNEFADIADKPRKKRPILGFIVFILVFVLGVCLGVFVFPNVMKEASRSVEKAVREEESFSSNDWTTDEFMLDGVYYRLNDDYNVFKNNGWTFDLKKYGYDKEYILNKGEKITTNVGLESIKYLKANVQVGFVNLSKSPKNIEDCQIWSITIDNHTSETPVMFMLPGGVQIGSSEQEIITVYGKPDESQIYRNDTLGYTTFHYTNDYTQYLDLTIYDEGGLQQLSFRHY